MILGVIEKFLNAELYCSKVWLDYSLIVKNRDIYVDDGMEKITGISTAYPTVETVIVFIPIVGRTKLVWSALITVIVIGKIFLK